MTTHIWHTELSRNAAIGGGGVYEEDSEIGHVWPELHAVVHTGSMHWNLDGFSANTADYGSLLASAPKVVVIDRSGGMWAGEAVVANRGSFLVSLKDRYGQRLEDTHSAGQLLRGVTVTAESHVASATLKGATTSIDPKTGLADFGSLEIGAKVAANVSVQISVNLIGRRPLTVRLDIRLEPCRLGDIPPKGGVGSCVTCEDGQYAVSRHALECSGCSAGAVCHGGPNIQALQDYWNMPGSTVFYKCNSVRLTRPPVCICSLALG